MNRIEKIVIKDIKSELIQVDKVISLLKQKILANNDGKGINLSPSETFDTLNGVNSMLADINEKMTAIEENQ